MAATDLSSTTGDAYNISFWNLICNMIHFASYLLANSELLLSFCYGTYDFVANVPSIAIKAGFRLDSSKLERYELEQSGATGRRAQKAGGVIGGKQSTGGGRMAPVKVEFLFDFGSPNAYLAELVIPEVEKRTGVKFDYVPVLLGGIFKLTNNRSPAEYLSGVKNKPEYAELETQRYIRRHNITTFHKNPFFPVNTLQLMRAAVAAQFEGVFESYLRAAYHHMWEAPKKMDDPEVAREAFISSNIDYDRLFARAQTPDVKNRLIQLTQNAVDRGVFGSPTFFVGEEMFFGKDQLRDVEEAIVATGAATSGERRKSAI
jgi:2-hydroxychromene-2-carboxylate isomerase